jgi:hypothetical protein
MNPAMVPGEANKPKSNAERKTGVKNFKADKVVLMAVLLELDI